MSNCLLIHLGVGLLSAFFGFLLGRLYCKKRGYSAKCGSEQHSSLTAQQSGFKNTDQKRLTTTKIPQFNAALAKQAYNRTVKENDLRVIEGIGPKIQHLFHKNNIKTWKSLANCSVENVSTFWIKQERLTESTTQKHGLSKPAWLMRESGKSCANGKTNLMQAIKQKNSNRKKVAFLVVLHFSKYAQAFFVQFV